MRACTHPFVLLAILVAAEAAFGQTQTPQIGLPPFGTFQQAEFDRIDASNANVHFDIPIIRRAGRGMDLWETLTYDSSVWSVSYDPTTFHSRWMGSINADWGWALRSSTGHITYSTEVHQCNLTGSSHITTRTNYVYHDSNGTTHPFGGAGPAVYWNECTNSGRIGFTAANATDQSGYQLTIASTYFMEPTVTFNGIIFANLTQVDGGSEFEGGGSITDTNGNVGPDTLAAAGWGSWTYPSPTNPANIVGATVNYTMYSVQTNFGCPATYEFGPLTESLITSVVLADGSTYTITYEQTPGVSGKITGRIASIHLPSGGTINYTYSGANNGIVCGEGSPVIMQRTTPDGTWTYSRSVTVPYLGYGQYGQPGVVTTTINDPLSNTTVANSLFGLEFKRQIYQGSTTLLQTEETCYNGVPFPCTNGGSEAPITRKTVRREIPNSAGLVSQTDTTYNPATLVTDVKEYDFGTGGPPATPIRTTHTDYAVLGNGILNRPSAVTVKDGSGNIKAQTSYAYDETPVTVPTTTTPNHVSVSGARGNVTTITNLVQGTATISRTKTYYDTGNVLTETDPAGHQTTYAYGTASCGNSFPTQVTDALNHSTSMVWDCNGAVKTSITDVNQQQTTFTYGDPNFWRLTQTNYPDGGQATNTYNLGVVTPWNTIQATKITSSLTLTQKSVYDALGRVIQTQLNSDPEGVTYVDTTYDAKGQRSTVSNPYRTTSDSTYGVTTYLYDGLGRVTKVIPPDGTTSANNVSTIYDIVLGTTPPRDCTTVTDQAGKARKSCSDGLGRLTQVFEDPASLNYETDYQYDPLDNLLRVDQKGGSTNSANWRTRTFAYNSLSQLLCSANPELAIATCPNPDNGAYTAGTVRYTYDNNGNLLSKTSPKPNQPSPSTTVVTNYTYDLVNRLTLKSFSDGGSGTLNWRYGYDGTILTGCNVNPPAITGATNLVGRRTAMCDQSGSTAWSFDPLGRVLTEKRSLRGSSTFTKSTVYTYKSDGSLATLTYPSGRILTYAPSAAGRALSAVDAANSINYVTAATYAPQGALSGFLNGSSTNSRWTYNKRLQPLQIYFTNGAVPSNSQLQGTCPTTAATILSHLYNFSVGASDNGNVAFITDCLATSNTQNFAYDNLNRLTTGYTTGQGTVATNWGENYTIDAWGNLTNIGLKSGWHNSETLNAAAASTQNQLPGFGYDAAGNMTSNSPYGYVYNGENQLKSVTQSSTTTTYVYDADGKRLIKCTGTFPTCTSGTLYWTGTGSDPLDEMSWTGTFSEEYVFFNGTRVARRDGTGNTVHYYFADHLGSANVVTSATGAIEKSSLYYPFGGEIPVTGASVVNTYKFTGKERDSESGLDMFGARYYASTMGRFMIPDWSARPEGVPYALLEDPQSLNLYAYVRNNPLNRTDPTGHCDSGGQKQSFWWCVGHALGFNETKEEAAARITTERQWLLKNARGANNAPLSQAQVNALKGASAQQVNSLYQAYDNAIFKAQTGFWSGAEVIYPASTLERAESGAFVPLSRLHSDTTITQGNSASYDFWKNKPTEEIIESLKPGSAFGELTVKPSGTVMDGNTRIKVLEERGIDVNTLERVIIDLPKEPI